MRRILFTAILLGCSLPGLTQPGRSGSDNLYQLALEAVLDSATRSLPAHLPTLPIDGLVIERDSEITATLPAQAGLYKLLYLDRSEVVVRLDSLGGTMPVIQIRPISNAGPMLLVNFAVYVVTIADNRLNYRLRGGAVVSFNLNCRTLQWQIDSLRFWGG